MKSQLPIWRARLIACAAVMVRTFSLLIGDLQPTTFNPTDTMQWLKFQPCWFLFHCWPVWSVNWKTGIGEYLAHLENPSLSDPSSVRSFHTLPLQLRPIQMIYWKLDEHKLLKCSRRLHTFLRQYFSLFCYLFDSRGRHTLKATTNLSSSLDIESTSFLMSNLTAIP
jgi:hypothetical protein